MPLAPRALARVRAISRSPSPAAAARASSSATSCAPSAPPATNLPIEKASALRLLFLAPSGAVATRSQARRRAAAMYRSSVLPPSTTVGVQGLRGSGATTPRSQAGQSAACPHTPRQGLSRATRSHSRRRRGHRCRRRSCSPNFSPRARGEKEMKSARSGPVHAGYGQPAAIVLEPGVAAVTRIDVENVEAGNSAGGHSDERPGMLPPKRDRFVAVARRVLETMFRCRFLMGAAGEDRERLSGDEVQRCFDRARGAGHRFASRAAARIAVIASRSVLKVPMRLPAASVAVNWPFCAMRMDPTASRPR